MTKREEALVILMEECGELIQACSKMIRSGGETKYGISKRAHSNVDIKNLTVEDACAIYREDYWKPCKAEKLPEELRDVLTLIEALKISGLVTDKQIEDRIKVKKEKLMKWSMLYE